MLGFGMSKVDKAILGQAEMQLAALAESGVNHREIARKLFEESKSEIVKRNGPGMLYFDEAGDQLILKQNIIEPRIANGVTREDFLQYHNRPQLVIYLDGKILDFVEFICIQVMTEASMNEAIVLAAFQKRRRTNPKFGDPTAWDPTKPINEGYSADDADLFIELRFRILQWQSKNPVSEVAALADKYSTYNAMVRSLMREGKL